MSDQDLAQLSSYTRSALKRLEQTEWFRAVGQNDVEEVIIVSSWQEALARCGDLVWENLQLDAANDLRVQILQRSKERFNQWNEVVGKLKPIIMPLVRLKSEKVATEHSLPKKFIDTLNWDILAFTMECEYADLCSPGFYSMLATYYERGHFPCGWEGEYPRGKLVLY